MVTQFRVQFNVFWMGAGGHQVLARDFLLASNWYWGYVEFVWMMTGVSSLTWPKSD